LGGASLHCEHIGINEWNILNFELEIKGRKALMLKDFMFHQHIIIDHGQICTSSKSVPVVMISDELIPLYLYSHSL